MTGLWLLIIFMQASALGISIWIYLDQRANHEAEIDYYKMMVAQLNDQLSNADKVYAEMADAGAQAYLELKGEMDALVEGLKEEITRQTMSYFALEKGFDEMEEGYQQMLLDAADRHNVLVNKISMRDSEIVEFDELAHKLRERIKALEILINSRKNTR